MKENSTAVISGEFVCLISSAWLTYQRICRPIPCINSKGFGSAMSSYRSVPIAVHTNHPAATPETGVASVRGKTPSVNMAPGRINQPQNGVAQLKNRSFYSLSNMVSPVVINGGNGNFQTTLPWPERSATTGSPEPGKSRHWPADNRSTSGGIAHHIFLVILTSFF